ncbi:MAG TPA: PIG-L deacetylase family protein, partial [Acidimicrobiia bacterium]|nr:PIG-L deacetylase family protein [Acidimicrobiia bacterium]
MTTSGERPVASYLAPAGTAAVSVDLPVPRRALAIGAHPDDIDFGCGATLAKWAAAGCVVTELVLTDGSKGSWDPHADRAALVALRQAEQRAAATALGAGEVVFLGHTDGELDSGLAGRAEVCRIIREARPDVVLGHDPWKRYRLHPDHRHAGFLAVEGIVAARDPHFFPEQGLAPHRPTGLLLWEADVVDHLENVDSWLETKLAALLAHRSQWESTMGIDADPDEQARTFETRIRARAAEAGAVAGLPLAEAFKHLDRL